MPHVVVSCPAAIIAKWRLKVLHARRRVFLAVMGVIRFWKALGKRRPKGGKGGLKRIDSFSYMIPELLGNGRQTKLLIMNLM
jgi:hypothetical protein